MGGNYMALLTKKSKYVNIVVRKTDMFISDRDKYIKKWCSEVSEYYAYIYHKQDKNLEGTIEHEHVHIVLVLKESQRLSTTLNSFCDAVSLTTLGVMIDKCNSLEGSLQYLIHKNDENKTQHELSEIVTNIPEEEFKRLMDVEISSLTPQRLRYLVKTCQSNYELIEKLGINEYMRLRKVISDIRDDFRIWNY